MGNRPRDIDGNVIPYPSDLKKRSRPNRIRPARNDARENAQKKETRAAAKPDEAVEQLRVEGLQNYSVKSLLKNKPQDSGLWELQ